MHPVLEELQALIRDAVLSRVPPGAEAGLAALPFDRLVQVYLNWLGRLVPPRPRRVHLADGLFDGVAEARVREAFQRLVEKVRAGGDLRPHLSRDIRSAYSADQAADAGRRRGRSRPDLDRLLAEWGVHHLHPGLPEDPDGTATRGDLVLFAHFGSADAYLIAVLPHRRWTDLDVVRTCVRSWPDAGIFTRSRVAIGLEPSWNPEGNGEQGRQRLRNAGVTTMLEVDGAVYMPPGQTLGGLPLSAVQAANTLQHAIWQLDAALSEPGGPDLAALLGADAARLQGAGPRWEAVRAGPVWQVREAATGVAVLSCAFTL